MMRCVVAQARRVRQLEAHQAWLQRNVASKQIQAKRHRALLMLRTELCLHLGCGGSAVEAAVALKLGTEPGPINEKSGPEGPPKVFVV